MDNFQVEPFSEKCNENKGRNIALVCYISGTTPFCGRLVIALAGGAHQLRMVR